MPAAAPYKPKTEAAWTRLGKALCAGCSRRALGPCEIERRARAHAVTSPDFPSDLRWHPKAGPTCRSFMPYEEPPPDRCKKTLELPL